MFSYYLFYPIKYLLQKLNIFIVYRKILFKIKIYLFNPAKFLFDAKRKYLFDVFTFYLCNAFKIFIR